MLTISTQTSAVNESQRWMRTSHPRGPMAIRRTSDTFRVAFGGAVGRSRPPRPLDPDLGDGHTPALNGKHP